jgi:hypothetical protein
MVIVSSIVLPSLLPTKIGEPDEVLVDVEVWEKEKSD